MIFGWRKAVYEGVSEGLNSVLPKMIDKCYRRGFENGIMTALLYMREHGCEEEMLYGLAVSEPPTRKKVNMTSPLCVICPKCHASENIKCVERGRPWGLRFIDEVHPERAEKAKEKLDAVEQGADCCS